MKKITVLFAASSFILIFLFSVPASAQFKKGSLMLGTTVGSTTYSDANSHYDYENGNTTSTTTHAYTLGIGPEAGVFLSSSVVLGATLTFNFNNSNSTATNNFVNNTTSGSNNGNTTATVMLEPMLRYYFAGSPKKNWFYMELHSGAGTGVGRSSGNGYTTAATSTSYGKVSNIFNWDTGAGLGMTHFFSHGLGLDFALGYTYSHSYSDNASTTITTNKTTQALSSSSNNYNLTTVTNGITFSVGFHRFF